MVLEQYSNQITPDTILIGHSLGVPFCLNVLERYKVKAAFLVAGFVGEIHHAFDENMKTFAQKEFAWKTIKNNCDHFKIYNSDNDPYIKLDKPQRIADALGEKITLVKNAGHFNKTAGYITFDLLLNDIKPLL
ncbi:MAG: hypothetical protein A2233_00675 [Candidatus Kerfeldbacteria bacterium RIFOXYA2_FULL_38_24]|nr:MAG: hypothetical protein A2233_00675 [Candidatus Kerfeldbacteria bacterium RIFOXYA2_FULL_38_24]